MSDRRLEILDTPAQLARRAADEFVSAVERATAAGTRCAVALSGGTTPRAMLQQLVARALDWSRVHLFWSDERCVPPDDPASNYGMADHALLANVTLPAGNVHRMRGELAPEAGADDYESQLAAFFAGPPHFDLLYLGLGPDGHTASLFPGTPALHATSRSCVANRVDGPVASPWRLTLTYGAINASRRVVFLVEGSEKAEILATVLRGKKDVERYPAQGIAPVGGDLLWLADAAAARTMRTDVADAGSA